MSDKFWTHTVLELFPKPLSGSFPKEGTPSEWIEEGKVLYAQGDDELVVYYLSFWKILWWKLKQWGEAIHNWLFDNIYIHTPWGKKRMRKVDEFFASISVIGDEELEELIGSEDCKVLLEVL